MGIAFVPWSMIQTADEDPASKFKLMGRPDRTHYEFSNYLKKSRLKEKSAKKRVIIQGFADHSGVKKASNSRVRMLRSLTTYSR